MKFDNLKNKILVLGNYRQTLAVVRSLALSGFDVVLGCADKKDPTIYSKFCKKTWRHSSIEDDAPKFISELGSFINDEKISYIFPVGEIEIVLLSQNINFIYPKIAIVIANLDALTICMDKFAMNSLASQMGLPVPAFKRVKDFQELVSQIEMIGYPCVVKPNDSLKSLFRKKAIILENKNDLKNKIELWPVDHPFLLVQKYISGLRNNCNFASIDGKIMAYLEVKVLRTDRYDGTGYGVVNKSVVPTKELEDYCERLVHKLNYTGVGCIQFIDNPNGFYFLEFNSRLDANCAFPFQLGYNFPAMAVQCRDHQLTPFKNPYAIGKKMHWTMGDLKGLFYELAKGEIDLIKTTIWFSKLLKTFLSSQHHLTWWWKDPCPTLFIYFKIVLTMLKRIKQFFLKS